MPARLEVMIASVAGRAQQMIARVLGGYRYATSALTKRLPGLTDSITSKASGAIEDELPESYGNSRVVLLVIDPYHLHAYWELTAKDMLDAKARLKRPERERALSWVLRFYDVTGVPFDTNSAHGHFDVDVIPDARNWYVELWSPDKAYIVELGPRAEGRFVPVCRSRPVQVPPAEPCLPQAANQPASPELALEPAAPELSTFDGPRLCEPLSAQVRRIEVLSESPVLRSATTPLAELPSTRVVTLGEAPRDEYRTASIAPEQRLQPSRSVSLASGSGSGSGSSWQPRK